MYNISSDIFFIFERERQIKQKFKCFEVAIIKLANQTLKLLFFHHASVTHAVSDGFLKKNWCFYFLFFFSSQ